MLGTGVSVSRSRRGKFVVVFGATPSDFVPRLKKDTQKGSKHRVNLQGNKHPHKRVISRSSCSEVFNKNGVIKNFVKLTRKHACENLFLKKVARGSA